MLAICQNNSVGINASRDPFSRLKGHSRLTYVHIRHLFIANLHITESRSVLFLTKYDKTAL